MSIASIVFGIVLSTLYGAGFHLWRGGGAGRLLLFLVVSWVGFWGGQFIADALGWDFDNLGAIHIITASAGSLVLLLLGNWLSHKPPAA